MERWTKEDGIQKLFEVFTASQRLILNSIDRQQVRFTKYQLYLMMTLARRDTLTMSQAACCIGCSKEQATRLVATLVEEGYVERLHRQENRKLVFIRLTEKGEQVMCLERAEAKKKLQAQIDCLSEEDKETFFQSLQGLAGVLKKLEAHQERSTRTEHCPGRCRQATGILPQAGEGTAIEREEKW